MVNSDQTWRIWNGAQYLNIAFLKFAKDWNVKKIVYGTSIGLNKLNIPHHMKEEAKILLKNFSGISVREHQSIPLLEKLFDINNLTWVVDPTLLIDKKYYFDLLDDYKSNFDVNNKYICVYKLFEPNKLNMFVKMLKNNSNYKFYSQDNYKIRENYIQRFLYCIYHSQAVITNSFHGTIFSIIFEKPFIYFQDFSTDDERFHNLNDIFNISNRIIEKNQEPDASLLTTPLNVNYDKLNKLREISNNFLKEQLFY